MGPYSGCNSNQIGSNRGVLRHSVVRLSTDWGITVTRHLTMNGCNMFQHNDYSMLTLQASRDHNARKQMNTKPNRLRLYVLILIVFLSVLASVPASAGLNRLTVVLVPCLTANDIASPMSNALKQLVSTGATGHTICRSARETDRSRLLPDGRDRIESLLLPIGAGARATADSGAVARQILHAPAEVDVRRNRRVGGFAG